MNVTSASLNEAFDPMLALRAWRKRWRLTLATFVTICAIAGVGTFQVKPKFESEASIYVRLGRESAGLDPTATTGEVAPIYETREQELNSALEVMESRKLLEAAIIVIGEDAILDPTRFSFERWQHSLQDAAWHELDPDIIHRSNRQKELAVEKLYKSVTLEVEQSSNVIGVTCLAGSPDLAQAITRTLVDAFRAEHVRLNQTHGLKFFQAQVETLQTRLDVLNEQTFWQIVRTERERADRSGVPVTGAIFTVKDEATTEHAVSGWNAAALCRVLRATARLTDHVGIAGENELGVVLWGTRELGAFRFVHRLGEKGETAASDCRLFVYPMQTDDERTTSTEVGSIDDILEAAGGPADRSILDRISDVEQKLAEALEIETPVVKDDDCTDMDESLGFGFDAYENDRVSNDGGTTVLAPPKARSRRAVQGTKSAETKQKAATSSSGASALTGERASKLNIVMEPLENLFMLPHPRWKRCLDVFGSVFGLIVLSPLLLAVAMLIKLTSPGPVLFRQVREGHGGSLFTIFKFRTMRVGADAEKAALQTENEQHGPAFKMANDPRITPIGSFLRKSCLDELPQLWNVLIGDMTLVGPRPLDHRESTKIARWGRRRLLAKPGLTCIWQVHGKSRVSFNEWMRMDIRYSQKISFKEDIRLVIATLKQVVLRQASH